MLRILRTGAAAAIGAALLSSPVFAATISLEPFVPPSITSSSTTEPGTFTNDYTFTLTTATGVTAVDTIVAVAPIGAFTSGTLELFMGTPGFGTPDGSVAITGASPAFTGSLTSTLLPGSYYYQVAATGSGTVFNSLVAVATVPELGTWAMVGIGFAALGYVGFAKRKRLVLEDFA
jgi:hypothetical protein